MSNNLETEKAEKLDKLAAEFVPSEEDISRTEKDSETALRQSEFPWEEALDTYDPYFPNYSPSRDAITFFNLMRLVQGSDFEVGNSKAQYFMLDLIFGNVTNNMYPYSKEINESIEIDTDRIAICCSRGLSKSTLITNFLFIYIALMGTLPNAGVQKFWLALGASSKGHARNMAISLRAICEDSEYMKSAMEHMHFTETEATFLRKGNGSEDSRYFVIRFMGIFTPTRGQKSKYNHRPDMALLDDCLPSHTAAYSPTIMSSLTTAIHSDLGNALKARGGKIINIFTPFNYNEPNTSSILNRSFTPVLIPVAKAFDNPEEVKQKEIISSWEQMHTPASVHKMWRLAKKSKTLSLFMQERMLRLTSGADRLVPDDAIQWCDMELIRQNIHAYNVYITTDYTTTSGEDSDFSGIATWACSNNEDWFMLDLTLRKRGMEQQYEETLDEADKWKRRGKHVEIGVEIDGNQSAHVHSLEQLMMKKSVWHSFARQKGETSKRKGILSKSSGVIKHERFRIAVQQFMLPGKMWFPEHLKNTADMTEFIQQIKGATHKDFARSDDGPDLISQLSMINVIYPVEGAELGEVKKQPNRGPMWAKLRYAEAANETAYGSYA